MLQVRGAGEEPEYEKRVAGEPAVLLLAVPARSPVGKWGPFASLFDLAQSSGLQHWSSQAVPAGATRIACHRLHRSFSQSSVYTPQ